MRFKSILLFLSILALSLSSCQKAPQREAIKAVTGDAVEVGISSVVLTGKAEMPDTPTGAIVIGVQYSLSSEDLLSGNCPEIKADTFSKDYSFSVEVEGLKSDTKYYYRTFAKESDVYTFGETKSFTTAKAPIVKLLSESASFDFMGHDGSVEVMIENPAAGCALSASTNDAWITDVKVDGNTVTYKVAQNNSGAGRFGSIKVQYGLAIATYKVTQTSPALSLSPNSAETDYTSKAQSFTYSIENPMAGLSVSATSEETWITGVKVSGNTVNYNVAENNSEVMRTGLIKLTYGPVTKNFSVTQTYSATGITFSPTSQSTDYTAKSLSFTFDIINPRNGATASVSTTDEWITDVILSGTTVNYKLAENNSGASRSGQIRLTYGSVTKEFSVTQTYSAPDITFTPESQSTDYTEKSLSFTYTISNPRAGVTVSVSTTYDWITDIRLNGTTVSYKVAENNCGASRSGQIRLTYGSVTKEFSVTQTYSATGITFRPSSQSTNYTAKSLSFTYAISNPRNGATASVSTTDAWITDVILSGTTVNYKLAENNSGASRTGKIKLTYGSVTKDFSVTQTYSATGITFSPTSQSTDYTAKSLSFTYAIRNPRENCSLGVNYYSKWITDVQLSGSTVSYKVAENNSGASRTGVIEITYGTLSYSFLLIQKQEPYNGHDYVDLGLSVKWATCNVGASNPEDYGGYYQWAGTVDSKEKDMVHAPYYTVRNGFPSWTKYWSGDNKTVLDPIDDVASVQWKGLWRMPTDAEWKELGQNCSWTWTSINRINGYLIQSMKPGYTSNWIFLPAAGEWVDTQTVHANRSGLYWSSSLYKYYDYANYVHFYEYLYYVNDYYNRDCAMSIRPVVE